MTTSYSTRRWRTVGLAIVALVAAVGCRAGAGGRGRAADGQANGPAAAGGAPATAASPLRVDGSSVLSLGDDRSADAASRLLDEVQTALAEGRRAHATAAVRARPDAALAALTRASPPGTPVLRFVAGVHDAQCLRGAPADGFLAVFDAPPGRGDVAALRADALARLEAGDARGAVERAARVGTALGTTALVWRIDALRLQGIALALDGRPADAAVAFAAGADLARPTRPYEAAHLGLLTAEVRRRAGDAAGAAAAWSMSVADAANLVRTDASLPDPGYWERAVSTRPPTAAWPAPVGASLRVVARRAFGAAADAAVLTSSEEALVWAWVARARLARGDGRAALLAASHAEATASDPGWHDRVRVVQAMALARMGELSSAQAILAGVVERANPLASPSAIAAWGTLELEQGRLARGRALLERALAAWPDGGDDGADAEANLALVLLAEGRTEPGLARLRAAQERFRASGRTLDWLQSLENELEYAERARDTARATEVKGRITAVHAGAV